MKKITIKLILAFALFILTIPTFGQEHKTINLEPGSKLLQSKKVSNGLVLLTGNEFIMNKTNWRIKFFDPHLTLRYDVLVPNPKIGSFYNSFFVISPSGKNVYFIRPFYGGFFEKFGSGNRQNIFHIDSAGISNSFFLKGQLKFNNVNVVFAEDDYLYYVIKEKDKSSRNAHAFPKLHFVRIAKDNSVSKIVIALPDPDPDATEWSYLGNTAVVSYFVSRNLDDESYKTQKYRIAVIDHDGKLLDDFKMEVNLKDGKFMAGYNYCGNEGTHEINNHNIDVTYHSSTFSNGGGSTTTITTLIYSPNPEAFGNIMIDPLTNGFYIYGLSGGTAPQKEKSRKRSISQDNSVATGYFVYKFDQDGKAVWTCESKLKGVNDNFKNKYGFASRQISLMYGSEGNLRFQAFAFNMATTYELDPNSGKFVSNYTNTFTNPLNLMYLGACHKPGDKSELSKLLSKQSKGDYSQLNFRMLNNNVVVQNYFHDARLEMYDFGDE